MILMDLEHYFWFCFSQNQCADVSEEPGGARGAAGQSEEEQVHLNLITDQWKPPETECINVLFYLFQGSVWGRERRTLSADGNS